MASSMSRAAFSSGERAVLSTIIFGLTALNALTKAAPPEARFVTLHSTPRSLSFFRNVKVNTPLSLVLSLQSTTIIL